MERGFQPRATIVPLAGNTAQETPVDRLKPIDFAGAVVGILIIGIGAAFTGEAPDWWSSFLRLYLISIIPFCISCAMIARRAGRSLANGLWGVASAFGVFVVTANALQGSGAPRR